MRTQTEYKTICNKCMQGTWYETEQPCHREVFNGCNECKSHENISRKQKCTGTLKIIDNSSLNIRATRFYDSGERVRISYKDGTITRCYIGKSIGWKPIYLEILKSNSNGGGWLFLPGDAKIEGTGKYK